MARIRTVKPELWTDEDFIDLTLESRLVFIASLNFADDCGVLADKPRTLTIRAMPTDDVDADAIVDELVNARFYVRHTAPNGDRVLVIRTFASHQKIDKRSNGRWGDPADWHESPPIPPDPHQSPRVPTTEGKGREGKGREKTTSVSPETFSSSENDKQADGPTETKDERFELTCSLIVDNIIAKKPGKKRDEIGKAGYRRSIANNLLTERGDEIRDYLRRNPRAAPIIAATDLTREVA